MITLPAGARILLATRPVDFRKGAHSLAALAAEMLSEDPFSGVVLVFRSKRADRIKLVVWDGSGLVLVWKQLEGWRVPLAARGGRRAAADAGRVRGAVRRDRLDAGAERKTDSHAERACVESPARCARPALQRRPCPMTRGVARAAAGGLGGAGERDPCVQRHAERDALAARNERLQHLLRKLQRMQFGRRSEQLTADQLQFAFEEVEASIADTEAEAEKRSPDLRKKNTARRRAGRGRLPAHLPRVEQVLLPESTACPCCQGAMVEIGCDTAERLDVIPVQFRALVTKRPKFACRACPGVVVQAPAPARLVEGGMPTEAAVAHVAVARYADHTPLYRQAQGLARQGIEIGREVLAGWLGAAAFQVRPVVARLREILLTSRAAVRRRDRHAGARPRPGPDQEGLCLGDRPRRPALGRQRPAGGGVPLRPGPRRRARPGAAGWLHAASCSATATRLQGPGRAGRRRRGRDPGLLLEPCPAGIL